MTASRPPARRASKLTALVRRKSPLERRTICLLGKPAWHTSHPTAASEPMPPPGRSSPEPTLFRPADVRVGLACGRRSAGKVTMKAQARCELESGGQHEPAALAWRMSTHTWPSAATANSSVSPAVASARTVISPVRSARDGGRASRAGDARRNVSFSAVCPNDAAGSVLIRETASGSPRVRRRSGFVRRRRRRELRGGRRSGVRSPHR